MPAGSEKDTSLCQTLPNLVPLIAGGSDIVLAVATAISGVGNGFGYINRLEAICLVASTTVGDWSFRTGAAPGAQVLLLAQPIAVSVVGTRYVWDFPHPFKTGASGPFADGRFYIANSVATMGTWRWIANGFYSTL